MGKLLVSEKIEKSFGSGDERRKVLDGVSVEIGGGEFVAVMGASGSGKSTLLYALSGMDGIDMGEVTFEGKPLSGRSDDALTDLRRTTMGFVFQLPQMRDHRRNVKKLTVRARTLMEQVGIAELEQRDVTQVSGGQLQRAGICRALMSSPKIVFADEPTGALNSKSSDEIMTLFSGIHRAGTAILLVTHDAKVAARAQRVLFMQDGKIVRSLALSGAGSGNLAWNTEKVLSEMKCLNI